MSNNSESNRILAEETVRQARAALADVLTTVEGLSARADAYQRQTLDIVEAALRKMNARTIDAVSAILAGVPASIRRHAPQLAPSVVDAIVRDVAQHALERVKTINAANDLLVQPPPDASDTN